MSKKTAARKALKIEKAARKRARSVPKALPPPGHHELPSLFAVSPAPAAREASARAAAVQAGMGAGLLEICRKRWQYGEWAELAALTEAEITPLPERGKLALLAAAGQCQTDDTDKMGRARHFTRLALAWGCSRDLVARVLTSSVHNSLARSAASLGEDSTTAAHFTIALDLVAPGTDVALMSRTRQIRETARMGLLPDAARLLGGDLNQIVARPADHTTRLEMLQAELEVFRGELMLSQARGQLYARPTETGQPPDFLTGLAAKAVSQLGQDLWVLERSQYRRGGYFVEFGATDGVMLSNSWLLEREFGWNGICAEPNPGFLRDLRANRRCQITDACIGATTGAEVEFILADVYGGIVDYAAVDSHGGKREAYRRDGQVLRLTTLSLEDLLIRHDAPREIDYLSIDTEGSEFDILRAFPFADWAIRLITVEHNFTPAREQIHALLSGYGYVRTEAKFDDWYELKS